MMVDAQRRRNDRRPDPRLQGISGSYGFGVEGTGSWRIEVHDRIAAINESTAPANCVVRAGRAKSGPYRYRLTSIP